MIKNDMPNTFLLSILTHQKRKSNRVNEAFEHFYDKTKRKIKLRSDNNEIESIMKIPPYQYGLSLYDATEIAKLIVSKLKKEGFWCKLIHSDIVYSNWSKEALETIEKKKKKRKKKKKKKKAKKEDEITNMLKNKWKL